MKRVVFLALLFFVGLAQASQAKPLLLVASPALQGLYSRSALIAVPAGEGHLGFIVNRATDVKLAPRYPLYFGGPEASTRSSRSCGATRGPPACAFSASFSWSPAPKRSSALPGRRPGELAAEIDAGFWRVAEADPALFFRRDIGGLWDELVQRPDELRAPSRGRLSV